MGAYTVERSATIAAPPSTLHSLVTDFHEWPTWSPWEDIDPDMQRTYDGPPSGVGARYAWSGNRKAGAGSMEITGDTPDAIDLDLRFLKPFKSQSRLRFSFEPADGPGSTTVRWRMEGRTSGLTSIVGRFMNFDKLVGPDFEKGLARMKAVAEAG